jgi:hypothetical protein
MKAIKNKYVQVVIEWFLDLAAVSCISRIRSAKTYIYISNINCYGTNRESDKGKKEEKM